MPTSFRPVRARCAVSFRASSLTLYALVLSLPTSANAQAAKAPAGELRRDLRLK